MSNTVTFNKTVSALHDTAQNHRAVKRKEPISYNYCSHHKHIKILFSVKPNIA